MILIEWCQVTIFFSILDKLIYNDQYVNIYDNLTDCNVGARRGRNIRDNILVINAIINSVKKKSEEPLDIQVYDVEKCFDSLWLHEVILCLYEAGMKNDKLPLLFLSHKSEHFLICLMVFCMLPWFSRFSVSTSALFGKGASSAGAVRVQSK